MIVAQVIIILPVIISVSTELLEQIFMRIIVKSSIRLMLDFSDRIKTTVFDARLPLAYLYILTGLGRATVRGRGYYYSWWEYYSPHEGNDDDYCSWGPLKGNLAMAMSLGISSDPWYSIAS